MLHNKKIDYLNFSLHCTSWKPKRSDKILLQSRHNNVKFAASFFAATDFRRLIADYKLNNSMGSH